MDFGNITTNIIKNGLVFNMDAANRASTIPSTNTTKALNTIDTAISGTFMDNTQWEGSTTASFAFDGVDDRILIDTSGTSGPYSSLGPNTTCNIWVKYNGGTAILIGGDSSSTGGYFFYASPSSAYSSYEGSFDQGTWTSFGTEVWINYCVTKNDSGNVIWYGNGQQLDTGTVNANAGIGFWAIGSYRSDLRFELNGNIANVQVYTRALSANEVLHNYNALKSRFE